MLDLRWVRDNPGEFDAALKDPALLKEVEQRKLELDPLDGAQLQASIGDRDFSKELIERARQVSEMKD